MCAEGKIRLDSRVCAWTFSCVYAMFVKQCGRFSCCNLCPSISDTKSFLFTPHLHTNAFYMFIKLNRVFFTFQLTSPGLSSIITLFSLVHTHIQNKHVLPISWFWWRANMSFIPPVEVYLTNSPSSNVFPHSTLKFCTLKQQWACLSRQHHNLHF